MHGAPTLKQLSSVQPLSASPGALAAVVRAAAPFMAARSSSTGRGGPMSWTGYGSPASCAGCGQHDELHRLWRPEQAHRAWRPHELGWLWRADAHSGATAPPPSDVFTGAAPRTAEIVPDLDD